MLSIFKLSIELESSDAINADPVGVLQDALRQVDVNVVSEAHGTGDCFTHVLQDVNGNSIGIATLDITGEVG